MRVVCLALIFLLSLPAAAQDMSALFKEGVTAVQQATRQTDEDRRDELLDKAIAAFRKMLVTNPSLVRVRLELARAFFLKGEDSLARRHFEIVLAGKPPAAVALNVNRFLNIMRARKRWSVRVGAALAPDTNLGGGSDERIILIDVFGQRLPFTYQGDDPKSGIGIAAWAGGEYQYPLDPRWRLRVDGTLVGEEAIRRLRVDPVLAGQRDALPEPGFHLLGQLATAPSNRPSPRRQRGASGLSSRKVGCARMAGKTCACTGWRKGSDRSFAGRKYRVECLPIMAPPSHKTEPPGKPGRFSSSHQWAHLRC